MRRAFVMALGAAGGLVMTAWGPPDAYAVRVTFVVAAGLAAAAALYKTARARRLRRPYLAPPPALATLVLAISSVLLLTKIDPGLMLLWGFNVGLNVRVLLRAVSVDRRAAEVRALKQRPDRKRGAD